MSVAEFVIEWLAKKLKVPADALRMFKTANALSGLNRKTLPTELIPLNTIQLARGLLNFTLLQNLPGWVLPYWTEQQYDPRNKAFIPRSHLGLSMNLTHRNWTAVGNPACRVEPIVDPRGLVTPFRGGWSVDLWLTVGNSPLFPSRVPEAEQHLVGDLPIVVTRFSLDEVSMTMTTFTHGSRLIHRAVVENRSSGDRQCRLAVAIRPFNPEGAVLLHDLTYDDTIPGFVVARRDVVRLSMKPDRVACSVFGSGDSMELFSMAGEDGGEKSVHCPAGLANGFAEFGLPLRPGEIATVEASCALEQGTEFITVDDPERSVLEEWRQLLQMGIVLETPDEAVNSLFRSSLATLLLLCDGDTITPGPSTYHSFWFRDAVYMIWALDKCGFSSFASAIVRNAPKRQERSGFFRSQLGEWDSNGQVLWSTWQHGVLAHDGSLYADLFEPLRKGMEWIEKNRNTGRKERDEQFAGLLPPGLSAEHLGLADYYFWDDFWALAGIEAFERICRSLGREVERDRAATLAGAFRRDIENAIRKVQVERNLTVIPAGPARGLDCGMIGSVAGWYPLQLFPPDDPRMMSTLRRLADLFTVDGLFFQNFIHSGKNPYLTLQAGHAWLYARCRKEFWKRFSAVLSHASPTGAFPEAIHPGTGGGSMGDGHHGWAAAEVVLALRDAFVMERWMGITHHVALLSGVPEEWYFAGKPFSITGARIPEGILDIRVNAEGDEIEVELQIQRHGDRPAGMWSILFPFPVEPLDDKPVHLCRPHAQGEFAVDIDPATTRLRFRRIARSS